jgi:hypothetical protein
MKKLLLCVLLLPTLVHPSPIQIEKEVICDDIKTVVATLMKFKETIVWTGKDDSSKYALLANDQTGTWTLLQFDSNIACVIGAGEGHNPLRSISKSVIRGKIL